MDVYQTIVTAFDNDILKITLNRPERLNVLNEKMLDELAQVFHQAANESAIKALLITGMGKAFCAGADIEQMAALNTQTGFAFSRKGQMVFNLLEQLNKPSIAAINGFAMGGGNELAMAATLRIASEKAIFAQPEVKLGLIPGYGGTQRLARLIGKGRALDICLTGRSLSADVALAFGLVSEVVAEDVLLKRAQAILQEILAMAPLAIQNVIEVLQTGYDLPLAEALQLEATHFGLLCATNDKNEGVKAFLDKRSANFKGN